MTVVWKYSDDGGKSWEDNGDIELSGAKRMDEDWRKGLEWVLEDTETYRDRPRIWRLTWKRHQHTYKCTCTVCGELKGI
jgi:hypothetical protein